MTTERARGTGLRSISVIASPMPWPKKPANRCCSKAMISAAQTSPQRLTAADARLIVATSAPRTAHGIVVCRGQTAESPGAARGGASVASGRFSSILNLTSSPNSSARTGSGHCRRVAATPCVPPASAGSRTSRPGRRPYGAARLTRRGAPIAAGKDDARAASEPGLRHAACHRTNRRFRVVGTRHPVAIAERVHEPAGRRAGVPGREQPEAEIPHATFGCAPLDRPPRCPCRRGEKLSTVDERTG